jgi:hypothetical protein
MTEKDFNALLSTPSTAQGARAPKFTEYWGFRSSRREVRCLPDPGFVAMANRRALPFRRGAFDSRGGTMQNGINKLAGQTFGRVEISDRKQFRRLTLKPSEKTVQEIERLEEMSLVAEQRLGDFFVGGGSS